MWRSEQDQEEDYKEVAQRALNMCDEWENRYFELVEIVDDLLEGRGAV